MPKLVSLYIRSCLIGFALSGVFVALILSFNVGNLWHLISTSSMGGIAGIMFFMFNGIVFAGAQFAFSILSMADDDKTPRGPRKPLLNRRTQMGAQLIPVRVRDKRDPRQDARHDLRRNTRGF